MDPIKENLKRASVEMILLALLEDGESKYAYQMAQQIKEISNDDFSLLEGSMYPILTRLCERGDLTYERVNHTAKMIRVYYKITDAGLRDLSDMRQRFCQNISLINQLTKYSQEKF